MSGMMVDHKATLNRLAGLIQKEKACAAEIYSEGSYADDKKQILDIASQKTGEEFIVLIIGAFSSGKTSMINALIGEDLLPTGFLPETAVLGELHYGSKKRITLYPKKGMWEGGDKPFDLREVTTEEISRYVSLSTEDAINSMEKNIDGDESQSRINAKFEKMIIYWPLDILKDGVVLVDSPGINDPYSNDYIVNDYLPKADAIVYVMDSQKAYTATDKNQLEMINALGRKNILTGYTFYD
ncbi:MAG: dynamin family protein, partial [Selenomonadaceae bacterium]|nr:dynamin family protein [Selenomonadaceae bacterium]